MGRGLQFLRFAVVDNRADLMKFGFMVKGDGGWGVGPLSVWNEIRMFRFLRSLVEVNLEGYGGSLEGDREILRGGGKEMMTYNERNVVVYRIGERGFLED